MKNAGSIGVVSHYDLSKKIEYLTDSSIILSRHLKKVFKQGWAMRPKKGQMYGKLYIQLFRKDVEEMFM